MSISEETTIKLKKNILDKIDTKVDSIILEKALSKVSLPENLEQLEKVSDFHKSQSKRRKENKLKSQENVGKLWYNMPKIELDEEQERDLKILRARSGIDLKRFYRQIDKNSLSKYIQVGRVVDAPEDYYSNLYNKEKPKSFVQQILDDYKLRRKKHKAIVHTRSQKKKLWKKKSTKIRQKWKK